MLISAGTLTAFAAAAALAWRAPGWAWLLVVLALGLAGPVAGARLLAPGRREIQARAVVAGMLDGVVSHDGASRVVAVNQATEAMFGWPPGELIGRWVNLLIDEPSREKLDRLRQVEQDLMRAGRTPESAGIRLTGVRRDGTRFPIEVTISADGPNGGRVVVIRDVSARREMEQQLKESQSFLNTVIETIPSPVVVYDPADEARYVSVNRAYEEMFGVRREFVVGKTDFDLIPARQARLINQLVLDVAAGRHNDILGTVQPFTSARGRRYLRATMRVIRDAEDDARYVVAIVDDLTDLYSATRQALLEEERANLYLRVADIAVVELSPDGTIVRVNQKLLRTLAANEQDFAGRSYRHVPFTVDGGSEVCQQAYRITADVLDGGPSSGEIRHFEAALGTSYFHWKAVANRHRSSGELVSVVLVGDDVTEINEKRLEAERANQAKSDFLANVSHELRTPLNAIIGYSEMLEEIACAESRAEEVRDLGRISAAGRHLLDLINNILDLSKIEAEQMEVRAEPFDLSVLLEQVRGLVIPAIQANGNELVIAGASEVLLYSDDLKVKQILLNLVANAAKFTRQGTVEVSYSVDDARARIQVSDTGIGMSAAQLAGVFEAFVQGDGSTTREFGGTGLGLAICDRLVSLLGGSIDVKSEPDRGTTFVVTLPQMDAHPRPEPCAAGTSLISRYA